MLSSIDSSSSSHELPQPQKSLPIKQDDKFFSRLMSKETSMANSSCRVYYGGASGAIPFMWESQPGTPKHPSSDISLPPLTPPPSYQSSLKSKSMQKKSLKRPNLLSSIFPSRLMMITPRKKHASPSSSSSSSNSSSKFSTSSSSSSLSSWSSARSANFSVNRKLFHRRRSYFSCSKSPVHSCMDDDEEEEEEMGSPTSTLCFGVKRRNLNKFSRGYLSMVKMKKALLSIVSHG